MPEIEEVFEGRDALAKVYDERRTEGGALGVLTTLGTGHVQQIMSH